MITLTLEAQPEAPLEAGVITPENLRGKSAAEISLLPVAHGNETAVLGDFFSVKKDGMEGVLLEGDLSRLKNIGAGMAEGKITIHGDAGMHLGSRMQGGEIHLWGNSGDWTGAEMTGGKIHVRGNAGHCLGGAYTGSRQGMNGGMIIVEGNAGDEAGGLMRRGLIVIAGDAGEFTGAFMIAGSIIVFGNLGIRAGAGSARGTIIAFRAAELLPTYRYSCRCQPEFVKLILQEIQRHGLSIADNYADGFYRRYSGDFNGLGKGEILIYE